MLNKLLRCVLCFTFLWSTYSYASAQYQNYDIQEDNNGNLYLQLPKQFVLIHSDVSIPLHVVPTNGLLNLYYENGSWKVRTVTESHFNSLSLTASDYNVEYIDFSGDGDIEVVIRASDISDKSFILYGVENGAVSFSTHQKDHDGIDLSQGSLVSYVDKNGDGYKDLVIVPSGETQEITLLGNAQDGFINATAVINHASELVGTTSGQFKVGEDGSANYGIPIDLPAGIAGVKPSLAFNYSSNSGDGSMGMGWSLSGPDAITRCPKNYTLDGTIQGVQLNNSDAFCYQGQRLIYNSSSSAAYGADNSTYHTEIDNGNVITLVDNNSSNGPDGFIVTNKAGETYYYGKTTEYDQEDAYIEAGGKSQGSPATMWLLKAIEDIYDNAITFEYDENRTQGETVLKTVEWGATGKKNSVTVNYFTKPRPRYGYTPHGKFAATKLIDSVEVKKEGAQYRKYSLDWEHGYGLNNDPLAQNYSHILAIQKCFDDSTNCHSPISFTWQGQIDGTRTVTFQECNPHAPAYTQVNCGSDPQTIQDTYRPFELKTYTLGYDAKNPENAIVIDFDGNGSSDIIYRDGNNWYALMAKPTHFPDSSATSGIGRISLGQLGDITKTKVIDYNADGANDLLIPFTSSGQEKWKVVYYLKEPEHTTYQKEVNDWVTVTATSTNYVNEYHFGSITRSEHKDKAMVVDVNGDGLQDLVYPDNKTLRYYLNQGNSFNNSQAINGLDNIITLGNKTYKQSSKIKNSSFLDVNGDGITDILMEGEVLGEVVTTYICDYYDLNLSRRVTDASISGTDETSTLNLCKSRHGQYPHVDPKVFSTTYQEEGSENNILLGKVTSNGDIDYSDFITLHTLDGVDITKDVHIVDFNGDGLSDILFRKNYSSLGKRWQYKLSQGDYFSLTYVIDDSIINASDINKYAYHRFVDINGDGLTDIIAKNATGNYVLYLAHFDVGNNTVQFQANGSFLNASDLDGTYHLADFNGDTKLDFLYEKADKWKIKLAEDPDVKERVISKISNPIGGDTVIDYGLLQAPENLISDGNSYYESLPTARASNSYNYSTPYKTDFFPINKGVWVVSNAASESASRLSNNNTTAEVLNVEYRYGGMLVNRMGRGSLGFEFLETVDSQTGITTYTKYAQQFPYTGMPIETKSFYSDTLISHSTNTLAQKATYDGGILPYISKTIDKKWAINSTQSGINATARTFLNRTEQTYNYDQESSSATTLGNVKNTTTKIYNNEAGTSLLQTVNTTNKYYTSDNSERTGRLKETTVVKTNNVTSESSTRKSSFTYLSNGMLSTATVAGLSQETYQYDSHGNKRATCVKDLTTNQQRCASVIFSDDGRYPIASVTSGSALAANTTNVSNYTYKETYLYNGTSGDSVTGQIRSKTTTDANGITTTQYFDIQGQVLREVRADGTQTNITTAYVNGANCTNTINNPCYYQKTSSTAKPDSYTWFDAFGRKIKTQTKAFDGSNWSSQYYLYDALSRNTGTSEPYFESSANGNKNTTRFNTFTYDAFGQVLTEINLDGYSNKRDYYGRKTTYTDAKNQKRHEYVNGLGQLSKVEGEKSTVKYNNTSEKDNVYNITDYVYNVDGKLTKVSNYASNDIGNKISVHNVYDVHGRKTDMYDSDKGHWQYTYNGFGELRTQTTAEGSTTTNHYDIYGRITQTNTSSYDGYGAKLVCNVYGTNKNARNVGKLTSVKQYNTSSTNCAQSATPEWQQSVAFDTLGRPTTTTTTFDGKSYSQSQTYDAYSRVISQTLPEGVVVTNEYSNNYLKRIKQNGYLLREINERNAAGQVTNESIAQGITRINDFDEDTQRLRNISVSKGNNNIHILDYEYDAVGNLEERDQYFQNGYLVEESFAYDKVNRLTDRYIMHNGLTSSNDFDYQQTYHYDFLGNIARKEDKVGSSTVLAHQYYYGWSTHANSTNNQPLKRRQLNSITKGSNSSFRSFTYDDNGNITDDGPRAYKYTGFDKPYRLTSDNGDYSKFYYGPGKSRYMRKDHVKENVSGNNIFVDYKTHYLGAYERIEKTVSGNTTVEHKYQIAGAIITKKQGESAYTRLFSHADVQGSVTSITDGQGNVVEQFIYDPWGKKQAITVNNTHNHIVANMVRGTATTRGYTGHEGISHLVLIHMNGRVYDPAIGRFLQADPFIQYPNNSQSYNRYSYVLNNPMSYTDPSGYFSFSKFISPLLRPAIKLSSKIFGPQLTNIVGNFVFGKIGGALGVAYWNYNFTRAMGGSSTGALKGAITAGATAFVFQQIGNEFGADSGFWETGGAAHIAAHAITGGVISELQGGKFGHGFFSAGLTKAANVNGLVGTSQAAGMDAVRIVVAATIGGTISKVTGGKFANGARTAAFAQAFNGNRQARRDDVSKKYEALRKRVVSFAADNPDANISLSNSDVQTIKNQMTIDAALAPKYAPLSENWNHQFGTFDTFIYQEGLASRNFMIDGEIYSGGNVNYIGVGALFRAYGYGPHGAAIGTTYWNVKQYMDGEGSHNLHQIYQAQPWTMSGYYNGITETGAF